MNTFPPPTPAPERVFSGPAQAALWFSLGVGLLVMQVGAYLVPALGLQDAALAIVLGSWLGAGVLAWTAQWGCRSGLSSAGLMQQVYGRRLARVPIVLNVVQLVGWTCFELVIMREGTQAIVQQAWGITLPAWSATLIWGALLTVLMSASMLHLVRRFVSRAGLPLVVLSLLWLSLQFGREAQAQGWDTLWQRRGDGSMGFWSAIDLVIAMPISWLPLVADYARHGQRPRGTFWGTWLGYSVANIWCYGLGVLMATVAAPGTDLLAALLLAQGGLVALGLILLDELDNAYGDSYSAALSLSSLGAGRAGRGDRERVPQRDPYPSEVQPHSPATGQQDGERWAAALGLQAATPKPEGRQARPLPLRPWAMAVAAACTVLAMVLPMHSLEPFLLTLSSVFVPLYGVMLGRLARSQSAARTSSSFALWMAGIALFQGIAHWAPAWGAALPTLVMTAVVARLWRGRH